MNKQTIKTATPLILRFHRLIDAFAKSDDERDFYLDNVEGFIFFVDLDKGEEELLALQKELYENSLRYCLFPKMTFYETKKFMEGFIHEKVYDIDTKEKLVDILQSREPKENFLEFIYDQLPELEKWQQYYNERSRIRIIEWLRTLNIRFVFEEDLEMSRGLLEKIKQQLFATKVSKEIQQGRDLLHKKAASYYSHEALNPKPKRGRPPKQTQKIEAEPTLTTDAYTSVPQHLRHFLFLPDYASSSVFSAKFDTEAQLIASLKGTTNVAVDAKLESLSQRLESLRILSAKLKSPAKPVSEEKSTFKSVFQATTEEKESKGKKRVTNIVKGILPPSKKRRAVPKEEDTEETAKKREAKVKKVSQIKKNRKKS